MRHNIVYQDNKSSILLEKNGRRSSSKRTRHINIRYFYVTDHIADGTIRIEHCPTKDMLADYFTKPLQGLQFYKLRDHIINIDPSSPYHSGHRSVLGINHPEDHPEVSIPDERVTDAVEDSQRLKADVTPEDRRTYRDVLMG